MKSRLYLPEDYPVVSAWWPAHGWPAISEALLPKCGVVIEDEGVLRAATWLYQDNSVGVAMKEWTVTNPKNPPKKSFVAIKCLVESIREIARSLKYGVILTSVKNDALCRCYGRFGFEPTDRGVTHMVMVTGLQSQPKEEPCLSQQV